MRSARLLPFLALGWLVACGGKTSANAETSDAAKEPAAACSWSSSFEPLDAAPMRDSCRAARMLVTCKGSDGSSAICMADQPQCNLPAKSGVTYTCANECKSTQFAAKCGTIMESSVSPPADCPVKMPAPGGIFYCCACSS